jgi:hypothetical protein
MDPVNKVIAAILNNDLSGGDISAGRKRRRSKHTPSSTFMGAFQRRVAGGTSDGLSGGLSGGGFLPEPVAPEAPPAPVAVEPSSEGAPTGGNSRSRSRSRSRSPRRKMMSPSLKRTHSAVMKRYDEIRRRSPRMPGNEALKMAMKSVRGKRM